MKIVINRLDKHLSEMYQKILFEFGYSWSSLEKTICPDVGSLVVGSSNKIIQWTQDRNYMDRSADKHFDSLKHYGDIIEWLNNNSSPRVKVCGYDVDYYKDGFKVGCLDVKWDIYNKIEDCWHRMKMTPNEFDMRIDNPQVFMMLQKIIPNYDLNGKKLSSFTYDGRISCEYVHIDMKKKEVIVYNQFINNNCIHLSSAIAYLLSDKEMVKFSDEWIVRNFTEKGFEVKRGRLTQLPREGYW